MSRFGGPHLGFCLEGQLRGINGEGRHGQGCLVLPPVGTQPRQSRHGGRRGRAGEARDAELSEAFTWVLQEKPLG